MSDGLALQEGVLRRRRKPKREKALRGRAGRGKLYLVKALSRALDVLDCFPEDKARLSLREIADRTAAPESSLYRILMTLEHRGYVRLRPDGTYEQPERLLVGRLYERAERLRELARPHLTRLAARFDETASLAYLFSDVIRVLDTVETFHEIRMTNTVGRVLPPHCSSLGKAITAFQTSDQMQRMLEVYGLFKRTEKTITDRAILLEEYEKIAKQGVAYDREETVVGGFCVGAPVATLGGHVFAAVSVSAPLARMAPRRQAEVERAVVETAQLIARDFRKSRSSG
ncbi:MAG: IclR family transcriptional regulator [Bryobacteraceae bacterium]|nr:IclR family transcriptional regulator [Bryobacteraceae bacterium]MDW8378435.1 IclR family transcriptional regulator [Bryobacterales bacterium]